ncbi:hypothetical protein NQ314_004212 [Rhamnusium bicolor]|uniref:Phosphotransferase n=1 Tax=Rhamnusium bicolor TaxID=1586634 RepID=A0AAV8ZMW1_9CUCU|nr:hypothetical protein NQ314_004212 [Rhamnusium bicolor]
MAQKQGDVKIEICAVVNDTTGTLVACAEQNLYQNRTLLVDRHQRLLRPKNNQMLNLFDEPDMGSGKVLINLEWGAFLNSINPGKELHEKMISGMYMGELVRLPVEKFTNEGLMFGGQGSDDLFTRGLGHATEQDYANLSVGEQVGEKRITVGIDGTLYRFHPHMHTQIIEKMKELMDPSIKYQLMLSEDGSGRGAALIAAVAAKRK